MDINKERNEQKLDLEFECGISKLLKKTYNKTYDLDSKANTLISKHLNLILNAYIKNVKELGTKPPKVEDIQKITMNLFPPSLKKYAISEAQKELFMAQASSVNFITIAKETPRESELKLIAKKKDKDLLFRDFTSGVKSILKYSHPNHKLEKEGCQNISMYLLELSESITFRLKHYKPNHRTVDDIQKIVEDLFPRPLVEHAKSEGQRMLFEYENKMLQFYPEKYKTSAFEKSLVSIGKNKEAGAKEFKEGLLILAEKIYKNSSLNRAALTVICKEINYLRYYFIDYLNRIGKPKTLEHVQNAVRILFPPSIAENAMKIGQQMVYRFEKGEFSLDAINIQDKVKKIKRNKKTDKDISKSVFEPGVISLGKVVHPKASLDKSSSLLVSETLGDTFNALIGTIHDSVKRDIAISDIQIAAKKIVPESFLEHALAEGEKLVKLCESEGLKCFLKKKKQT